MNRDLAQWQIDVGPVRAYFERVRQTERSDGPVVYRFWLGGVHVGSARRKRGSYAAWEVRFFGGRRRLQFDARTLRDVAASIKWVMEYPERRECPPDNVRGFVVE